MKRPPTLELRGPGGVLPLRAEDEPLAPGHPMWDVPGLLITPHVSGFRRDHWDAVVALFAENRRRFAAGTPLLNVVDKGAGY